MKQFDANCDIVVFERRPPGHAGGWGVVFWDDLVADLRDTDPATAQKITDTMFRWTGQVLDVQGERVDHEGGGYGIARAAVLDILTERATSLGVDVRFGTDVSDPAEFADADVVVAGDGVNSLLRDRAVEKFGTTIAPGANRYVWLGSTKVFDKFTFGISRTEAGWIWFHAYAFDPLASTFIVECTEATWRGLGLDTGSAFESLRSLEQIFAEQLKGESLMSSPGGGEDPTLAWLNFRAVTNERWYAGNTVLMGDAAHTTHFSIGSGMRLAIQDAISLARALQGEPWVQAAFATYEADRRAAMLRPQTEARFSQQWFENAARYMDLPPEALFVLLRARRDPLMPRVSPKLYYRAYKTIDSVGFLRTLRHRVGPKVRALYGRTARKSK
jgi:2-polyprenyl-6-methoxyphenol hydroxylase-like FAD-dependent oxidoreductase